MGTGIKEGQDIPELKDGVGFFSWDLNVNRVYADQVFAYIYGIPYHDVQVGASIESVISNVCPDDIQRVAKAIHETILSGHHCHQTYRIRHPSGRTFVVTGQGRCLRNAEGDPSIYTGWVSATDIDKMVKDCDPLATHCLEALRIAKRRRHALAERYLASALGALGRSGDI